MRPPEVQRVVSELGRLSRAGLDSESFRFEAMALLRRAVPADAWCWTTADPETNLVTGAVGEGIPPDRSARFFEIEYQVEDFNKFSDLARGSRQAGALSEATDGDLNRSARYREIFGPLGIGEDLRVALRADGCCWGFLVLHREQSRSFTHEETNLLLSVAASLAAGLRLGLALHAGVDGGEQGTGLMLLNTDLTPLAVTPSAARYLALTHSKEEQHTDQIPDAVRALAAQLALMGNDDPEPWLESRVPTSGGGWLTIQATRVCDRDGDAMVALLVTRARPSEMLPMVLLGYKLTAREAQIASCVLRGLSTREIAQELGVAASTVQEHLKAVFDKLGVRSRRELTAAVFGERYWPRMAGGAPLGADGLFAR